jgi:hypothetical protein
MKHGLSHFRGVVWPRQGVAGAEPRTGPNGHKLYRYAVVGLVVTDQPLENLEGKGAVLLDGHGAGMAEAIDTAQQKRPAFLIGDANDVLLVLDNIVKEDDLE